MKDSLEELKNYQPQHEFFIGFDSDGCVFDSMEIKHKECFCPQFINHFDLQPVSRFAREVWEFINLYSRTRGCNRYLAVLHVLDLLEDRKEVRDRHVALPEMKGLREWVDRETKLGIPALERELKKNSDPDLKKVYAWALDVDDSVEKIVRNLPPFPFVRESLERIRNRADAIVVSQTPHAALDREWEEQGIAGFVRLRAGQEIGTKTEHLGLTVKGRYAPEKSLTVGDAPGDLKAAKSNNTLFFPINPGSEEASWERFFHEALDKFFNGTYQGEYERELIDDFYTHLPENPPWNRSGRLWGSKEKE